MDELPFSIEQIAYLLQLQVKIRYKSHMYVNCPFCVGSDGKPDMHGHMNINFEKNVFRCNRCTTKGGMVDLYALYYGMTRKEAFDAICEQLHCDNIVVRTPKKPRDIVIRKEERESLEEITKTYNELLNLLTLSSAHKQNLINRGLTVDEIEAGEYKSTPVIGLKRITNALIEQGCKLKGIPGFYLNCNDEWTIDIRGNGIMIPVRDDVGTIQGIQIRRDEGEKKYYWFTSNDQNAGTSTESCMHYANMKLLKNNEIFLTEGPLKADIASNLSQRAFIAIPGSSCYKLIEKNAEKLKWHGVEVIVNAMDMDRYTNMNVMKNVEEMKKIIEGNGFKLINLKWEPKYKGIDDYLLHKKQLKNAS